jgi:hypothetical protein
VSGIFKRNASGRSRFNLQSDSRKALIALGNGPACYARLNQIYRDEFLGTMQEFKVLK